MASLRAIEAEVKAAYRWILGREADEVGLSQFVDGVASGAMTLDGMREIMFGGPEFRQLDLPSNPQNRKEINNLIAANTGYVVQNGPFAGMPLRPDSMRGDGDLGPKLLGTYEQELHPFIERFASRSYDAIVDVGCAEGYYTVGLARLFRDIPVLAYDTDPGALTILREIAEEGGCGDRIVTGNFCDSDELGRIYKRYPNCLVIADCEGYERTLFSDTQTNGAGAGSDIIIECHDVWFPGLTAEITAALTPTHDISIVYAGGRNPNAFPFLAELNDLDRWRAVWERRAALQNWLVCEGVRRLS